MNESRPRVKQVIDQQNEAPLYRYAACVEYDGAKYCGWQRQDHSPSVQEPVEEALSKIANHKIKVICAGRTDTGVHATGQVIHFDSSSLRKNHNWTLGASALLPKDIRLSWVTMVPEDFHARFSAVSRTYHYLLLCSKQRTAISPQAVTVAPVAQLDIEQMQTAMNFLLGKHDFSAFRGAHCQAKSPVRHVEKVHIERVGQIIRFEIRANAFLLHMVRNIVGALTSVGTGELSVEGFKNILDGLDRRLAPAAALPNGLYLSKVEYPAKYDLPNKSTSPWFMP